MKKPKILPDSVLKTALRGSVPHGKLRKAKITIVNPDPRLPMAGAVKYVKGKNEVEAVLIPRGGGMYSTAVTEHEGTHASVSGKHKRPAVTTELDHQIINIVEDCYVEQLPLPSTAGAAYRRQRLFPAFKDLLSMIRGDRKAGGRKSAEQRNGEILIGARCLAIIRGYGVGSYREDKVIIKLERLLGRLRFHGVLSAVDAVRRGKASGRNKAIRLLRAIIEPELDEELDERPPADRQGDRIEEGFLSKEKGAVQMEVVILKPAGASTSKEKALTVRYAPSGVLINQARMTNAIITGDATGLFLKRRKLEAGGVVLIDASGSMDCDAKNLQKLCQLIPAAIIAFYSGNDGGRGGKLCVFARNRKRFSGTESQLEQFIMGGNCVDLPALRWLGKLSGPRYLVTDRGYCGGAWGDALAAQALTDSMLNRGQLVLIPSFTSAFAFFDKTHGLHRKTLEAFGAGPHKHDCGCKACQVVNNGDFAD